MRIMRKLKLQLENEMKLWEELHEDLEKKSTEFEYDVWMVEM